MKQFIALFSILIVALSFACSPETQVFSPELDTIVPADSSAEWCEAHPTDPECNDDGGTVGTGG